MGNDMRKLIDQVKNFGNPLNENILKCNINELYKSVLNYVNTKLNKSKDNIKVELRDNDYVLISYNYNIGTDASWNRLDDSAKIKKLQLSKNNFEKSFSHYKNFCKDGIRGVASTFNKDVSMVTINSTIQLDMIKMTQADNTNRQDKRVYRYNESNVSEISNDLNNYVNKYGDDYLNTVHINVGLFIEIIN
jgi:CHAT domain-containing protein